MKVKILSAFLGLLLATKPSVCVGASLEGALLDGYRAVQIALSKDTFPQAVVAADLLGKDVQKWIDDKGTSDVQYPNVSLVRSGVEGLALAKNEKDYRSAFGTLSKGVVEFLRQDTTLQAGWQLFFCSMTPEFGYWVQLKGEKTANPYHGKKMLSCGSKKKWSRPEALL